MSFFFLLGFELRVYILTHSISPFLCWVFIFQIGPYELFALAGFQLRSS
jgi:hypothetical protein